MKKRRALSHQLTEAEGAVTALLRHIGENPHREGLLKTPHRVAKALKELTAGYAEDPAEILSTVFSENTNEMVIVRGIEFWSLCEHHLMPFSGTATIGYLPKKKIVGLSKMARLVHCFSRRLQVQERLTEEIAHAFDDHLKPLGVGVIIRATHTCMSMRGVRSSGEMVTSCLLGEFRQPATRGEFLSLRS